MKTKKNIKHRGEMLQEAVLDSGMSVTMVTKKSGYSRSSYYNHINDPELPFDIMEKYGRALKHDFSDEFPELNSLRLEEEEVIYGRPDTLEKALYEYDRYRAKYITLLEEHKALLRSLAKIDGKTFDS
jgi:hypothetical protein